MVITVNGEKIEEFIFPDGQPHVKIPIPILPPSNAHCVVRCSLRSSEDVIKLMLVADCLNRIGTFIDLEISYLLGARMDRAISVVEPFTLEVVCKILNTAKFSSIRIFNVHSEIATNLLRAENILPFDQINKIRAENPGIMCVAPDKGARKWIVKMLDEDKFACCEKTREVSTGKLTGFKLLEPQKVKGKDCLIIDDICDGGGTFVGVAKELRKAGATSVILYVSHGIFSKSLPLEGIDYIYTTNSRGMRLNECKIDYVQVLPCF